MAEAAMGHTLRVGTRAGVGLGVLCVVLGSLAGATYWRTTAAARVPVETPRHDVRFTESFEAARADAALRRQDTRAMLKSLSSPDGVPEYRQRWEARRAREAARLDALQRVAGRGDSRDMVQAMQRELADYDAAFIRVLDLVQDGTIKTPRDADRALMAWLGGTRY
jgi:hypothetical protein